MNAFSPTGVEIIGLTQTVPATAAAEPGRFTRLSDGSLDAEWTGDTDLHWNDVVAETDAAGQVLWVDADGALWPESEIVLRDRKDE